IPQGSGVEAPAGSDSLTVRPSGLEVTGGFPALKSQTDAIAARLKDKRVSVVDLFAAARDLEAAYARAGYLLVRVSLPPQTLHDGQPLKLVVTDGYVETIDVSALPSRARERVSAVLAPLLGRHALTQAELERRLLLAGDIPGVALRSTLKPGQAPGATIIAIDGRYDAVTGQVSVDNSLGKNLGRYALGVGTDFNNLLGLGEVGYLRLTGYPGFNDGLLSGEPRNRQIVAGFTLPLTIDGLWLGMEGADSRTHPASDLAFTLLDHYQRLSTRLGYSWVRGRSFNTSSIISFDIANETQTIDFFGSRQTFTEDRTRVLRLTQQADAYLPWGATLLGDATLSFGLDALGARSGTAQLPLSRDGAEPDFTKLELSGRYNQSFLEDRMQWSVAAKAQTSFGDPLVSSEQFSLGGFDWLSGFGSGRLEGDSGAALRSEISFPIALPAFQTPSALGAIASPYLFAAAGIVRLEEPSAIEQGVTRAASYGAGIRFGLSQNDGPSAATLNLEYAHGEASGRKDDNRFNLRFITTF
ncbi:ShlB/FhaC/HecB family hemolysin secretion/activation protein, partial [Shinella sp.]